jgi:hypothetical protein
MKFLTALIVVGSLAFPTNSIGREKIPHVETIAPATHPHVFRPMNILPAASRAMFKCIMWNESRSTLNRLKANDYNASSGAGGIFQFVPYIWQWAAKQLNIRVQYAQEASITDQFRVAAYYYKRNNGFYPEWSSDISVC